MYCKDCGKPLSKDAFFCSNCGINIKIDDSQNLVDNSKENINYKESKLNLKNNKLIGILIGSFIVITIILPLTVGKSIMNKFTTSNSITPINSIVTHSNNSTITFSDKNLELAVRDKLKKRTGDILKSDVDKITYLEVEQRNISNLSGIEHLTNLESLDLNHNPISNIDALSGLNNLTRLDMVDNKVSNINALSKLTNLTSLNLNSNQISNVDALSKLTNLTYLDLYQNRISNINALSNLTNLTYLNLRGNNIHDYSPTSSYYKYLKHPTFSLK